MVDQKWVVYFVYYKGEVVYIGEGLPNRPIHATSGKSQCYDLNRLHFTDPTNVKVQVEYVFSSKKLAKDKETQLIKEMQPRFNKAHTTKEARTDTMRNRVALNRAVVQQCLHIPKGMRKKYTETCIQFCQRYTADELFSGIQITRSGVNSPFIPDKLRSSFLDIRNMLNSILRAGGKSKIPLNLFMIEGAYYVKLSDKVKEDYCQNNEVNEVALCTKFRHVMPSSDKCLTKDHDVIWSDVLQGDWG
jgi:hypothetical protein